MKRLMKVTVKGSSQHGFSLTEMMIVVVIMGIIATVALPSYQNQIRASHRKDTQAEMYAEASEQEKQLSLTAAYVARTFTSDNGRYSVVVASASSNAFQITATAQGQQTADTGCTSLTLDHLGNQTPRNCW